MENGNTCYQNGNQRYQTLTPNELSSKLQAHRNWVKSRKQGERLILRYYDLSELNLSDQNLHEASFYQCMLVGTDLTNCDLRHASFIDCLLGATDFRLSKLYKADFTGSNLTAAKFGGSSRNGIILTNTIQTNTEYF
jgi:uncharacterized protein YjbI with pentapeptide repeats